MNRKEFSTKDRGKKISQTEFKKKEKECRKLQQELTQVSVCPPLLLTTWPLPACHRLIIVHSILLLKRITETVILLCESTIENVCESLI